jgi:hypothetical protein
MTMRRINGIAKAIIVGIALGAATVCAAGCLSTTDEDYTGEFHGPGDLELQDFPNFSVIGDDDDDNDTGGDDDDDGVGQYCQAIIDCYCVKFSGTYYDQCVDGIEALTESYCQDWLETNDPECLP